MLDEIVGLVPVEIGAETAEAVPLELLRKLKKHRVFPVVVKNHSSASLDDEVSSHRRESDAFEHSGNGNLLVARVNPTARHQNEGQLADAELHGDFAPIRFAVQIVVDLYGKGGQGLRVAIHEEEISSLTRVEVVLLVEGGIVMSSPGRTDGKLVVVVPLVLDGDGLEIGADGDSCDLALRSLPLGQALARVGLNALPPVEAGQRANRSLAKLPFVPSEADAGSVVSASAVVEANSAAVAVVAPIALPAGEATAVLGSNAFTVGTAGKRTDSNVAGCPPPTRFAAALVGRYARPLLAGGVANGVLAVVALIVGAAAVAFVRAHASPVVQTRRIALNDVAIWASPARTTIFHFHLLDDLLRDRYLHQLL